MEDAENRKERCGRGIEYRRMWISRKPGTDELYIGYEFIENGEVHCANSITMRCTAYYQTDDKTAMSTITDDMAVELMNDLWKAGIRPSKHALMGQ